MINLRPSRVSMAALLCICSCVDREATAHAELAEVCGQTSPVWVLPYNGPIGRFTNLGQFGERRVVRLAARDLDSNTGYGPGAEDEETWSFGPCGESPMQLDVGPDERTRRVDRWPDLLLSCDESGAVRAIDPAGVHAPNFVFELPECVLQPQPEGLVNILPIDQEFGTLVLQAWPDDPWTESAALSVLLEPVYLNSLQLAGEQAFVRTAEAQVRVLSWVGGQSQLVVQDAYRFYASDNGRYVVWQDLQITNADPERPEGPVSVLDRETGETHYVRDAALSQMRLYSSGDSGAGFLRLQPGRAEFNEYLMLPSFEIVTFTAELEPGGVSYTWTVIDNGRVWDDDGTGTIVLHDLAGADNRVLFEGGSAIKLPGEDAINVLELCCDPLTQTREDGPLWHVPFEGERVLLAERATRSHGLAANGRVVTTVGQDQDWVGELIVVEPTTLEEQRIDTQVFGYTARPVNPDDPGSILYFVDDGARSGVWLTRLAP